MLIKACPLETVRDLCARHHGYGGAGGVSVYSWAVVEDEKPVAAFCWQPPAPGAAASVCKEQPAGVLALSRMVAVEKTDSRRVLGLAAGETRRRILVADDVAENREILRQMLGRVGFEVRTANDGGETLELVEAWHPHLILMDLRMPGMDGLKVLRELRAPDSPLVTHAAGTRIRHLYHDREEFTVVGAVGGR